MFRALTAALGVSARHGYDMNSLAVPRRAKEAIGAIACLKCACTWMPGILLLPDTLLLLM